LLFLKQAASSNASLERLISPLLRLALIFAIVLTGFFADSSGQAEQNPEANLVAEHFYFVESTDSDDKVIKAFTNTFHRPCQTWQAEDKALVKSLLEEISKKCPDLLIAAAGERKLALIRVGTLPAEPQRNKPPHEYTAEAGPGCLVFGDEYFSWKKRLDVLTMLCHELVHAADSSYSVAYSKLWIDFAQPTISRLRLRSQLSTPAGQNYYSKLINKKGIWTSLYGSTNMIEGLAEYLTSNRSGEVEILRAQPDLNKMVVQKLLKPSAAELDYREFMTQGRISCGCHEYDKALATFLAAHKIDSRPISADFWIAYCCLGSHKSNEERLSKSKIARRKSDALRLTSVEPSVRGLFVLQAGVLNRLKRYREAKNVADEVLETQPFDPWALQTRSVSEKHLRQFGACLQDVYCCRGFHGLTFYPLTDIESDPEFVDRAIGEIKTSTNLRYRLNAEAQYYLQVARQAKDRKVSTRFYRLAIANYDASLDINDKYKLDTVVSCIDISLQLGDLASARRYYDRASGLDASALPTKIAEVKILEAEGNSKLAEEIFHNLFPLVQDAKPDDAISFIPSFEFLDSYAIKKIDAKFLGL
jgi:tetratricopeptide (TPR) repeat protein